LASGPAITPKSTIAATTAIENLIQSSETRNPAGDAAIAAVHAILVKDDPYETRYDGKIRDIQTWIKGSDYSPIMPALPGTSSGADD
jgi:hypothetical protein